MNKKQQKPLKLSETMQQCLEHILKHGCLVRTPGGFWVEEDTVADNGVFEKWFGVETLRALERRGFVTPTRFRTAHRSGDGYPIRFEPTQAAIEITKR